MSSRILFFGDHELLPNLSERQILPQDNNSSTRMRSWHPHAHRGIDVVQLHVTRVEIR